MIANTRQIVFLIATILLSACGGSNSSDSETPQPNLAPSVVVDDRQNVEEQSQVSLSATASDSDGTISTYQWQQLSGPSVTLNSTNTLTTSFQAPITKSQISLVFQITVTDNDGATSSAEIEIIVEPVNLSPDLTVLETMQIEELSSVGIDANAQDPDGEISGILWQQINGPSLSLSDTASLSLTVTAPEVAGDTTAQLRLTVTDDEGATTQKDVVINIQNRRMIVSISIAGRGTVTSDDYTCTSEQLDTFLCPELIIEDNNLASLTLEVADNFYFSQWLGCDSSTEFLCEIDINQDASIEVELDRGIADIDLLSPGLQACLEYAIENESILLVKNLKSLTCFASVNTFENIDELVALEELKVSLDFRSPDQDRTAIAELDNLHSLTAEIFTDDLDPAFQFLSQLNLTALELSGNFSSLDIDEIVKLPYAPSLKRLALSFVTLNNVRNISQFNDLSEIAIDYCLNTDHDSLISALSSLSQLSSVTLSNCSISDISNLDLSPGLVHLDLSQNELVDVSIISQFTELQSLSLYSNDIDTLPDLSNHSGLIDVNISSTYLISDLSTLSGLTSIKYLDISGNDISDISDLTNLTNIERLDVSGNNISDISAVATLENVERLDISANDIGDITAVTGMEELLFFEAGFNSIVDISPLGNNVKLEFLDISSNDVTNIDVLENFPSLRVLRASGNQIASLDALTLPYSNLDVIDIGNNPITDFSPLAVQVQLQQIFITNSALASLSFMEEYSAIHSLDISASNVSDISALADVEVEGELRLMNIQITDLTPLYNKVNARSIDLTGNDMLPCEDLDRLLELLVDVVLHLPALCVP